MFVELTGVMGPYVIPFIMKVLGAMLNTVFNVAVNGMFDGAGKDGLDISFISLVAMLVDEGPILFCAFFSTACWATRAFSRVCPANFPLCEMQNLAMWPVCLQCEHMRGEQSRSRCPVWETSVLDPSPPSACRLIRSFSYKMQAMTVFAKNPGSFEEAWTCDCMYSNSPPRALMST